MELDFKNLNEACRTCLVVTHEQSSIFSAEPRTDAMIEYCTGVSVRAGDGLPAAICDRCRRKLRVAYHFVRSCRQANETLRKLVDRLEDVPLASLTVDKIDIKKENDFYDLDVLWESKDEADAFDSDVSNADILDKPVTTYKHKVKKQKISKKSTKTERKQTKRRHICSTCGVTVQSPAALAIHLRTHTGERPFVCHHCGGRYAQKSTLQVHIARRHSPIKIVAEKKFKCDTCGKAYATSTNLKIHIRSHTGETPFACTMCPARFTQVGPLLAHRRRHFGEKPHKCDTCDRRFGERTHLLRHRSVHTDDRPFECGTCGVRLKSSYALKKHIERHSSDKPHVCDKCGMAFKSGGSLNSHTRNIHSEKSGWCTTCQKPVSDLSEHSLTHSGEKRHACTLCDARFSGRRGLAVHFRQHNAPDFPCSEEGCSRVFHRRWQLDSHLLKHSARDHVCRFCSQGFTRAGQLTKHLNLHHEIHEKGHGCDVETKIL